MSEKIFPSSNIDDDTFYEPSFWKYGSYEMEKKYYPLIGELISVFNSLEDTLSEELVDYIENDKMPNAAQLIISKMNFSHKWQLWSELLLNRIAADSSELSIEDRQEQKEHQSRISKFRKTFERYGKIRNDLVHGTWGSINEQGLIKTQTRTNGKGILVHVHIEIKEESFKALIDEIEQFELEFEKYNENIHNQLKEDDTQQ
jgi:hypothetical protein